MIWIPEEYFVITFVFEKKYLNLIGNNKKKKNRRVIIIIINFGVRLGIKDALLKRGINNKHA